MVVKDYVGPLVKIPTFPGATLPGFDESYVLTPTLDITVYHEYFFRELLHDNMIKILYLTVVPPDMVVFEKEPLKVKISLQRLKGGIYTFIRLHERASAVCWRRNQIWTSKKKLLHVLRALNVAIQLAKSQKIENITAANIYWPLCASTEFASHQELVKWYKSHYDPLYKEFTDLVNVYKGKMALKYRGNKLEIFDYLQDQCHNDPAILEFDLSIAHFPVVVSSGIGHEGKREVISYLFEREAEALLLVLLIVSLVVLMAILGMFSHLVRRNIGSLVLIASLMSLATISLWIR